jgi:signal transduction histidine kinase
MLIALAGGTFFAVRGLRPVRDLIQTTRSIVATGRTATRVPERGSGDELDELTKLFNQMLERIESLIGGMREALDNVAHDLRTPMTRLRGIAEMSLQARAGDDHQCQEALASCVEESDRILKLLNSLMDISEAETGTLRLQFESIKVPELIQEVVELYEYVAEEKAVTISVDCPKDAMIVADRSRLRQVLANLLDNAIKYNARGGRVSINVHEKPEGTVLTVEDNGVGIRAEEIPKIWDRLHRGDASRSQPGLGLGLSLVRAIVHAHGGRTEVQSQPGSGSAFTVIFPRNSSCELNSLETRVCK